jgi:hypothetical protein
MMARGPYWLCSELAVIRRNLDKTDAELAGMFPGRNEKAILDIRLKHRIMKRQNNPQYPSYPQAERGIQPVTDMVNSR